MMGTWKGIVVHCSDSIFGNAIEIDKWHRERGWKGIGYHFVIGNGIPFAGMNYAGFLDGTIETGKTLDYDAEVEKDEIGAHTLGMNTSTIGICLIGIASFTPKQYDTLKNLLSILMASFGIAKENIVGHRDTESGMKEGKTCPNFDVREFVKRVL